MRRIACGIALALLGGCAYEVDASAPPAPAQTTKVYASNGDLLTSLHAEQDREHVPLDDIAPALREAVVAIEDSRFFTHHGVDLRAVLRAIRRNTADGGVSEGGSTITQQYVKNVLLDPSQTVDRKVKEAVLAFQLERRYPKEVILDRYLNRIYFGNGAYGVEAAARLYFERSAGKVNLPQAALLAGLVQAPERTDPFEHPDEAQARRNVVLDRMEELGDITAAEADRARGAPLGVKGTARAHRYPAPYFVEKVKQFVLDDPRFGDTPSERRRLLFEEGLRIRTTLDPAAQRHAEAAVARVLTGPEGPSAAVILIDPTNGYVRAHVGGRDFFGADPQARFDLATQGRRQSGSSFKPFVLAAALAKGTKLDRLFEAPGSLTIPLPDGAEPWVVENYEGSGGPPMTLVDATVTSVNTVYAQLIMEVGPEAAMKVARDLGVRSKLAPYPSAVLGTNEVTVLDMASAYSAFAADGMHSEPVFVTEITRADGSVVYRRPATRERVLPAEVAQQVNGVLAEVVKRGTGKRANFGRPIAGKTGTTQQWRDAWFVGYTPDLVGAVWVGYPGRQRSMVPPATPIKVTGGSWPAQIWRAAMAPTLAKVKPSRFVAPPLPPAPAPTTKVKLPVPDVESLVMADARSALKAAGFKVALEKRPSPTAAKGAVAEQIPSPGALALPGSGVTLVVSTGRPRTVAVPDVMGLPAEDAVRLLREAGLVVDLTVSEPPAGVKASPGRVWRQGPAAGTKLEEGDTVEVRARR